MSEYNAIIIGSGPNGLAAAIELARNRQKVLVIEGADTIGGGTRTGELTLPGFQHDHCSAVHPMAVLSPYLKTLPLAGFGLHWIYPEASVAHPMDEAPTILLSKSIDETSKYLGKDAKAWEDIFKYFTDHGHQILEDSMKPLGIPKYPYAFTKFGMKALLPASTFANFSFKEKYAKALFAGCSAHSVLPLEFFFTAALGLIFGMTGHMENWPIAQGGSQAITNSMAAYFRSLGGEIQTSQWVRKLQDLPMADAYIFDTDPVQLAQIAETDLPTGYRKRLMKYNYGPGAFKLDWALDGPIPWKDANALKASTVHLGGTLEEIAVSERMAWEGKHCDKPFVLLCQQSNFDASRAPKGKHTGYAYCHVPNGSTKNMTDAIENQIERFAPGFKDIVLKRHTTHTAAFHDYNPNYVGGAITGGAANLSQLFTRPVARLNPYTTPNPKIFICSAATPPGGGVHGMCGYWAAKAVLKKVGTSKKVGT
jgi:phytoene dehydrogenase-like protein